jgi:uroporphyrinogen decarboxylase
MHVQKNGPDHPGDAAVVQQMTSRERVLAAFNHCEGDRVPVWLGASPEFRLLAQKKLELPDDESLSVYLGDDFRRVFSSYAGPQYAHPTENLQPGSTYRTPFGIERHGYGYGQPLAHPLVGVDLAQIEAYPWPDPSWMDVSQVRADALKYEKKYAILGGDWSPFWHDLIDLLGMAQVFYEMHDHPERVDAILHHVVDYYFEVSRRIFDAAGDAIDIFFIGNDFGTQNGPVMSVRTFRRFMLPHLERLIRLGHDYGLKVAMHCCGGFAPLIPSMIEAGLDGLQALQPSCRGMGPADLKAAFGDRLVLMGCIDTQHVLIEGNPQLVREKTHEVLQVMMPGGGYVASPSHDYLLPETPVENVITLYQAILEFGKYH